MSTLARVSVVVSLLAAAGCTPPPPSGEDGHQHSLENDQVYAPMNPGVFRSAITKGDGPNGAHLLFVNFDGAALKPPANGFSDNSATNTSWIAKSTVSFPAFDAAPYAPTYTRQQAIDAIVAQVTTFYKPYNVIVTSQRPASGRYLMMMVGAHASLVMSNPGSAVGVAPVDCGNLEEANVGYAFAKDLEPFQASSSSRLSALKSIAVTVAHEAGHSFGLEHTQNTADIMYPSVNPAVKGFGGVANLSGGGNCASGSQDSNGTLLKNLGAGTGMTPTGPLPKVTWLAPTNGASVPTDFVIAVSASVQGGTISRVEIESGGQVLLTIDKAPYKKMVTAPGNGQFELSATAYDSAGNNTTTSVMFEVDASAPAQNVGCLIDADCDAPEVCKSGTCAPPSTGPGPAPTCDQPCPAGFTCQADGSCAPTTAPGGPQPGEIGAECADHSECNAGLCAEENGKKFCTAACDPNAATTCPAGTTCALASGTDYICKPTNAGNGGGCSAAPARGSNGPIGAATLLALLFPLALLRLRRRRSE